MKNNVPLWQSKIDTTRVASNIDARSIFMQQELIEKNWASREEFIQFLFKPESVRPSIYAGRSES